MFSTPYCLTAKRGVSETEVYPLNNSSHPMPGSTHRWRTFSLIIVVMLASANHARPQDANAGGKWQIIVDCQVVVMPQKAALPLIPDLSDETKMEAAWTKVQKMIGNGEATLSASLFGRAKEGTRLVAETIEELRFPTEFAAITPPLATPPNEAAEVLKHWPVAGPFPKSFETRNVGWALEFQSAVSQNGQWIHADVVLSHVRLLRFSQEETGKLPSGVQMWVPQPQFASISENFRLQMHSGRQVLVSTHKIPELENTMELAILRVRTVRAGGNP